jgi:hypothetical protein
VLLLAAVLLVPPAQASEQASPVPAWERLAAQAERLVRVLALVPVLQSAQQASALSAVAASRPAPGCPVCLEPD